MMCEIKLSTEFETTQWPSGEPRTIFDNTSELNAFEGRRNGPQVEF